MAPKRKRNSGNQRSTDSTESKGNSKRTRSKQPSAVVRWIFVWNNYKDDEVPKFLEELKAFKYIYQKEKGEIGGTKHLQGYVEFKKRTRSPSDHFTAKTIHWERAKGDQRENLIYCSKSDTRQEQYVTNFPYVPPPKEPLKDYWIEDKLEYKPWQQCILDILKTPPDQRSVCWFWEKKGGAGKSMFARHLTFTHEALVVGGKQQDIFQGVKAWKEEKKESGGPRVIIVDIPRTTEGRFISYSGIEKLKDGLFFCGKYESAMQRINRCHVIVFSNQFPDTTRLSYDRWTIFEI